MGGAVGSVSSRPVGFCPKIANSWITGLKSVTVVYSISLFGFSNIVCDNLTATNDNHLDSDLNESPVLNPDLCSAAKLFGIMRHHTMFMSLF